MPKTKQTKIGKVQSMLCRPTGASLQAICEVTGWQPHSAWAALSTLRKKGAAIERRSAEKADAPATYHMPAGTEDRS